MRVEKSAVAGPDAEASNPPLRLILLSHRDLRLFCWISPLPKSSSVSCCLGSHHLWHRCVTLKFHKSGSFVSLPYRRKYPSCSCSQSDP